MRKSLLFVLVMTPSVGFQSPAAKGQSFGSGNRRAELEVGKITGDEVQQLKRRRESLNLWGFGFGPYALKNMDVQGLVYAFALTNHREVSERGELRFRLGAGVSEKGSGGSASATIGGAYMPFTGDVTPVLGAEFGFGYSSGKKIQTTAGFAGAGILGLRFFRTSDSQMELTGRYEGHLKENEFGRPATYGMQLSILF